MERVVHKFLAHFANLGTYMNYWLKIGNIFTIKIFFRFLCTSNFQRVESLNCNNCSKPRIYDASNSLQSPHIASAKTMNIKSEIAAVYGVLMERNVQKIFRIKTCSIAANFILVYSLKSSKKFCHSSEIRALYLIKWPT